jgi:hypothetical protein
MGFNQTGLRRYLPMIRPGGVPLRQGTAFGNPTHLGNATSIAFTLTKGGLYLRSALPFPVFPMGESLVAFLYPFARHSTAINDKNFDFRVWLVKQIMDSSGNVSPQVMVSFLTQGRATLSAVATHQGVNTDKDLALDASETLADTITSTLGTTVTTPAGPATVFETALAEGASAPYSPTTDLDAACIILPSLGRHNGIMIDFDLDVGAAAPDSANFLIDTAGA